MSAASPRMPWNRCRAFFLACAVCGAALFLNSLALVRPALLQDDWQMVVASWTWQDARAHLFVPHNEHSMPPGRLTIWLMARLAGMQSNIPAVFAWQGPLALLVAMVAVYFLVRRESGEAFLALLAMALFGVNTHYQNAINWFSASFGVVALDMLLLGALAAQRWRQTGRRRYLGLSALWCGLAPGWFGSGALAGPLCTLYLLVPRPPSPRDPPTGRPRPVKGHSWPARLSPALVPLMGTLVSLAITLPLNGKQIANLPRVEQPGVVAWQTFKPFVGAVSTARAMVDDLIPGAVGFKGVVFPPWVVVGAWAVFVTAGAWWWWRAPYRALLALALGLIVGSYGATYTVRAHLSYEEMHAWGRYHLFAHLGLVLFVCGGLPRRWSATVNAAPAWAVDLGAFGLLALLVVSQSPRMKALGWYEDQHPGLERVERIDALCRELHIDAATAREALPPFEVAGMWGKVGGREIGPWDLLRGSPDPRPMTVDEARALLDDKARAILDED